MERAIGGVVALIAGLGVALIVALAAAPSLPVVLAAGLGTALVGLVILLIVDRRRGERRKGDRRRGSQGPQIGSISGEAVVSIDQRGGQIARSIVNVGPQPRTLEGSDVAEMVQYLKGFTGTPIRVSCALGDGDAAQFAEEVKELLKSSGWIVEGVSHAVRIPPIVGVVIQIPGKDPDVYPWWRGICARLQARGIQCKGAGSAVQPEIHIGLRP